MIWTMFSRANGAKAMADQSASSRDVSTSQSAAQEGQTEQHSGSRFLPRRIGIYGARSAGKTCYLAAALLGASSSAHGAVVLADEKSRDLLLGHWEKLESGCVPPATALDLSLISASFVLPLQPGGSGQHDSPTQQADTPPDSSSPPPKRRISFEIADFGGRLCERGETGDPALTEEFRNWLKEAHGLLFLLAIDQLQDPQQAKERLLEVDALLNDLMESGPTGQAAVQPIAILVTKWDLVGWLSEHPNPDEELEHLRQFLVERAGDFASGVCDKIKQSGETVKLYPVSTFGGHENGRPRVPLRPFNVHPPLRWVLEQSDYYLYEQAHEQAEAILRQPKYFLWNRYSAAIAVYEQLRREYGIAAGPVHQKLEQQIEPLRTKRLARRRRLKLAVALLVLLGLVIGSCVVDRYRFVDLTGRLKSASEPFPVLQQRVNNYKKSFNPWAKLCGHKKQVDKSWDSYFSELKKDFQALKTSFHNPPDSSTELKKQVDFWEALEKSCAGFKRSYPQAPQEKEVDDYLQTAQMQKRLLHACLDVQALERDWQDASDISAYQLPSFRKRIDELTSRLAQPSEEGNSAVQQAEEALRRIESELQKYESFVAEYQELQKQWSATNRKTEEIFKAIDDFFAKYPENQYARCRTIFDTLKQKRLETRSKVLGGEIAELRKELDRLEKEGLNIADREQGIRDFLAKIEAKLKEPTALGQEITQLGRYAITVLDEAKWQEVVEYEKNNPKAFDDIASLAQQYLNWSPAQVLGLYSNLHTRLGDLQPRHTEEAKKRIGYCIQQHWAELYKAFYERATGVKDAAGISNAENAGREAMNWLSKTRAHYPGFADAYSPPTHLQVEWINQWLRWAENLRNLDTKMSVKGHFSGATTSKVKFSVEIRRPSNSGEDPVMPKVDSPWFGADNGVPVSVPVRGNLRTERRTVTVAYEINDWGPNTKASKEVDLLELFTSLQGRLVIPAEGYKNAPTFQFTCDDLTPPRPPAQKQE